jgi:hypothetical protein
MLLVSGWFDTLIVGYGQGRPYGPGIATGITDVIADIGESAIDGEGPHPLCAFARRTGRTDWNVSRIWTGKQTAPILAFKGDAARQDAPADGGQWLRGKPKAA